MIDLRSDTVTRPTPAMREAIARADVGDDVYGEDPTVHALEEETASILGKEAALFVTSGTMGNQLAIAVHTRPGDEVIVGVGAHVVFYESGAGAALSGVQFTQVGEGGIFDGDDVEDNVQPTAYYVPHTSLVCVENTHNRAGGIVFPQDHVEEVAERARQLELALHLDGARLWNASVASGRSPAALAAPFDTVSVCFSKGLGAPVGSALCGTRKTIERARRLRKMWGGGMRQSGLLAAGALHALHNHRERLKDDHVAARAFAEAVAKVPFASVDLERVETNIVNIDLETDAMVSGDDVAKEARALGLLVNASGIRRIRAVTHLDVTLAQAREAAVLLGKAIMKAAERVG